MTCAASYTPASVGDRDLKGQTVPREASSRGVKAALNHPPPPSLEMPRAEDHPGAEGQALDPPGSVFSRVLASAGCQQESKKQCACQRVMPQRNGRLCLMFMDRAGAPQPAWPCQPYVNSPSFRLFICKMGSGNSHL